MAGLAVDSVLKTCAMRRSCDNITSVVIGFDNFYRKLDECRKGAKFRQVLTTNDHEVIEDIHFAPCNDAAQDNVIYIESDDHQESVNESQTLEGADEQSKVVSGSRQTASLHADSNSLLYGETGTT